MIGQDCGPDVPSWLLIVFSACWAPCQADRGIRFVQDVTAGAKHG